MIKFADVVVDLQAGDTGKGKVTHSLCKTGDYTTVIRYNGGGNAGHTIFHNDKKFVTHLIPCGILYGMKSIIGPGCVVNVDKLFDEIKELESNGIKVDGNLFVDKRAHIITKNHIEEDSKDIQIGTTKTGNGPSYRDKYYRVGVRAEHDSRLNDRNMVIDIYDELYGNNEVSILFEGAQGFELDIDWGDYPYVTSSHCTVGSAVLNGVPPQKIRKIYGIAKAYRTYVGLKSFEGESEYFEKIRQEGGEFGATTGRPRQINWLNVDDIIKSININGVTNLIFNKIDILEKVGVFNLIYNNVVYTYNNSDEMQQNIKNFISNHTELKNNIIFSKTPYDI